ncbi:MAG TPA: transcriptional regulator [Propionibacteriaceae bacterium]|nr:transcriptional regulator [Propionibacteriaceae bacterium]
MSRKPPFPSSPELLVLHAVRLLGMGDDDEVAGRFDLDRGVVSELLLDFEAMGWVTRVEFAGTGGWTLTSAGRTEGERRLAEELAATDSRPVVEAGYRAFLPRNEQLLRAATDWQLRPSRTDPLAANDHTDGVWDQRVLDGLTGLSEDLRGICRTLTARLGRFQGYDQRFSAALDRVHRGDLGWVNRPKVDSCHTVWMQLHEDLLATLALER